MVGRTPEYLGKTIEAYDVKMAMLVVLVFPLVILGFSAISAVKGFGASSMLAPVRRRLDAEHLIVVPHGFLHYLPFTALEDAEHSLIDEFSLSGAPSSSVHYLCAERRVSPPGRWYSVSRIH
jgi:potassium-transporting ATPase A subunit/CHAT domain-containing protein